MYIIPRLLYGLESLIVTNKQICRLEEFARDLLKRIQTLPTRTTNEAPYILFDTIPAEGLLDIKTLTFLRKMINDKSSIMNQIGIRQLAVKTVESSSWFIYALHLTHKYSLRSPHQLLSHSHGKRYGKGWSNTEYQSTGRTAWQQKQTRNQH